MLSNSIRNLNLTQSAAAATATVVARKTDTLTLLKLEKNVCNVAYNKSNKRRATIRTTNMYNSMTATMKTRPKSKWVIIGGVISWIVICRFSAFCRPNHKRTLENQRSKVTNAIVLVVAFVNYWYCSTVVELRKVCSTKSIRIMSSTVYCIFRSTVLPSVRYCVHIMLYFIMWQHFPTYCLLFKNFIFF